MSLSATLFGSDSAIFKVTNVLGLGVPGWLNRKFGNEQKPTVQRLGELASQTAKEGEARPIVWGRVRPISGNIMHCSKPRVVKREVKGQSSGGKGGKKKAPKQYEERVFRTYAIRICEGPITAIVRVWRNNKLVYDARGNAWGAKNNGVFLRLARFYLGSWDQMPDPTLESVWGAGEVPGYRGTCYMVVADEDLTSQGGAVPQYIFEVERAEGTYLTSQPYRIEQIEQMASMPSVSEIELRDSVQDGYGAEFIEIVPSVDEILLQGPIESAEFISVLPGVDSVVISEPTTSSEYLSAEPAVESVLFSITYQRPAPPTSEPDAMAVVPTIDEVALE